MRSRHLSNTNKSLEYTRMGYTFIDLFAGIGGFRLALEELGGNCVFSSEWDRRSQSTYFKNFGEVPFGDITKISAEEIPEHDVLCAGFPCQAFSISGKRQGFSDTRGTLFFEIARIVKHHKPKVLFLENVKNFARHDGGKTLDVVLKTLDELGYRVNYRVLRSSDYGVPQARERIYFVAFRKDLKTNEFVFPIPIKRHKVVEDILEPEPVALENYIKRKDMKVSKKREVLDPRRPKQIGTINKGGQGERIYSIEAAGITLSAHGGGAASKTGAYYINGKVRKLTPRECARMQGFPESYVLPDTRAMAYKQYGDSVSVPVLRAIFEQTLIAYPGLAKRNLKKIAAKSKKISPLSLNLTYQNE